MALDQQRNWDISMAENLQQIRMKAKAAREGPLEQNSDVDVTSIRDGIVQLQPFQGPPIHLPDEIITEITSYVYQQVDAQKTLASCCLLSHQWYNVAVPYLYEHPRLYGKNFDPFARTICPSINLHVRKSPLSSLIRVLDMGGLVHQGGKSITARLLGRSKASLESFRAPQASFAINCLPALARCTKLRHLDLSLVSESPPLLDLLKSVSHLDRLESFRLPRSTGFGPYDGRTPFQWPVQLRTLVLSGGIDAWFMAGIAKLPDTLRSITIEHCPVAKSLLVVRFMVNSVRTLPHLEYLKIANMPRFDAQAMDDLLYILPNLKTLSISVDYISPNVFDAGSIRKHVLDDALANENIPSSDTLRHEKLHTLELTNSGSPNVEGKITPIDLIIALDDDVLPALRVVKAAKSLFWRSGDGLQDTEALVDALQLRNKQDWESRRGEYEDMPTEQWKVANPAKTSGVWFF